MTPWLLIPVVLLGSFLLTGLIRWWAVRIALLDVPNRRSSHTVPTPRGGGLAIVVAFLAGVAGLAALAPHEATGFLLLFLTALMVAVVGLWDDLRQLSARYRILVHFLAAILLVGGPAHAGVPIEQGLTIWQLSGGLILVLAVVWALNLFNFMDGIDGLAAGETVFVAVSAAFLLAWRGKEGEALLNLLLAAAGLGFLVWNWPPAKIFMGDVGSGFVGFVLAALALRSAVVSPELPKACWLILPGVFFADATSTLLRRMVRRERWYDAHRSHAYQQAATRYGSHRLVTLAVMAINLFWLLPLSVLCVILPGFEVSLTILAYLPLLGLVTKFNAGGEIIP